MIRRRAIFRHSREPIAILDPQGRYLEQNAAHAQLLGYTDEDLRKKLLKFIGDFANWDLAAHRSYLDRSSLRLLFYLVDYNPKGDIM